MAANGLTIDRLSVHARGSHAPDAADTAALRVALEQALRQVRPFHLPPQAVLVIRTLASRTAFGAGRDERLRWRQQFEVQLADLAREALRPDRQHIPSDANCVLFDDEVTLLACLTRDVLAGRWTWYWDELFPRAAQAARLNLGSRVAQSNGECLLAAWLAYPQAVPHTLVVLRPAAAAAALSLLSPAELSRLAHGLHATFALPRGALDAAGPAPSGLEPAAEPTAEPNAAAAPGAPWREWLSPHHLRDLVPPAEYLLGLCYTLAHRPQEARGQEFGRQARRWLEDMTVAHARRPAARPGGGAPDGCHEITGDRSSSGGRSGRLAHRRRFGCQSQTGREHRRPGAGCSANSVPPAWPMLSRRPRPWAPARLPAWAGPSISST